LKINKLNIIIAAGFISIIGIVIAQLFWTKQAFDIEEKKFSQKVHIALLEVAKKLYQSTNRELPAENPVKKMTNDYYIVNIDNDFDANVLEFYLKSEFSKMNISTDFEYAMYNCQSQEMVYGNYISMDKSNTKKASVYFPKHKNLVYYFAVRFPNQTNFLFNSLGFWLFLSIALLLILAFYSYSVFTILQQKKYSDLQRDFINNMTHEFKTPLSSILIASKYLQKQKTISEHSKLLKYNNIIINQGEKLNSHIEQILNIAKSDHQPLILDKIALNIVEVLQTTIENIKLKYNQITVEVKNQSNDREQVTILADKFHFGNLIFNLLENAIKYCDEKPKIEIEILNLNGLIQLNFLDNGIGIPLDKQEEVFGKFVRLKTHKSIENSGFGLGLYYVKKIVTLHKWKIFVHKNKSKGSVFSIQIPRKNEKK
jgi:two-component system, OmpR family, phosphate regulon sensor histidine kinase PhoR